MIASVFAGAFRVLGRPAFLIPAFLMAAAADIAVRLNGWPTSNFNDWPVPRQFSIAIIVLLARGWFDLTLIAVGIGARISSRRPQQYVGQTFRSAGGQT